jgi:hypothetical protein
MPVVGLVDAAVAAAVDRPALPRCLHLDIHLHRAVLTELDRGDEIVRGRVAEDNRIGLLRLYDTWALALARTFVRTTRFDPLHRAATEQVLYVQLHNHLAALAEGPSTTVAISSGGRRHAVELELESVVEAARPVYEALSTWIRNESDSAETTLLLSDRVAALPGLAAHLGQSTDAEVVALHPAAAAGGALAHADLICPGGDELPFITRLPAYDSRPSPVTVAVTPPPGGTTTTTAPTHLVIDGTVHRITAEPFSMETPAGEAAGEEETAAISKRGDQVVLEVPSAASVTVNDEKVEGAAVLATGDRVRVAPAAPEILLVTMGE